MAAIANFTGIDRRPAVDADGQPGCDQHLCSAEERLRIPGCAPITAPCATLNYALSVTGAGGQVTVLDGGQFGPVVLTKEISIVGIDPQVVFEIDANPAVQVGCVGGAVGTCSVNNGYGVEIAAGANDTVKLKYLHYRAGASGAGALKLTSGGQLQLTDNVYRGNDTTTGPIVALYPNNPGTTQAQVYFAHSDIGFSTNGGAVEVNPSANTSLKLQFNPVEVHNASFGIRTNSSLLSGSSVNVTTSDFGIQILFVRQCRCKCL